jgi:hypothetical protein
MGWNATLRALRMPLERLYSFPFDAFDSINTGVWYALCLADPQRRHQPEEYPGRTRYRIAYNNVLADLFVAYHPETTTVTFTSSRRPTPIEEMLWSKI